jgi:hypothetical protein
MPKQLGESKEERKGGEKLRNDILPLSQNNILNFVYIQNYMDVLPPS